MYDKLDKAGEYFKRSFFAVDGLWFVMIEDDLSFEKALKIDEKVWTVMPKIQSQKLRELYDIKGHTLQDLIDALKIKFELEGYTVSIKEIGEGNFHILIYGCPWFNLMKKSGREELACKVGERICRVEFQAWTDAFNKEIKFQLKSQLCGGEEACQLIFQHIHS